MNDVKKSIIVWGLHGVGKTSMINSLPHELEKLSREDGLFFKLTSQDESDLDLQEIRFRPVYNSNIEPTLLHEAINLNLNVFSPSNPQIRRKYKLVFIDDKGDEMKAALDKTKDVSPSNNIIRNYLEHYSNGVIAIFEYDEYAIDSTNKHDRADLLISLMDVLSSRNTGVSLAICLNKIDRTRQRWKNPKVFFEMFFESNWEIIQQITREATNNNVKVNFFVTSMVGYCRNSEGMTIPNFSKNELIDGNILRPWNVTAPLFWMLESLDDNGKNNSFLSYFNLNKRKNFIFPKSFF